jgi:hypothetical protein
VVDRFACLGCTVEDAAVATGGDLPLEGELEIPELVDGDDVATLADTRQRAVDDLPSLRYVGAAIAAPAGGGLPVEERPPSSRLLLRRQRAHAHRSLRVGLPTRDLLLGALLVAGTCGDRCSDYCCDQTSTIHALLPRAIPGRA